MLTPSQVEILRRVYLEDEEKRFTRYAARMKELGGGKVWNWSAADVEAKLIKLGFEEAKMDDETKRRQRRRNNANNRRRSAAAAARQQHDPHGLLWQHMSGNGLSGQQQQAHHRQYALPQLPTGGGQQHAAYDMMSDTVSTAALPQYTSDQENDILDQLDRKYGGGDDDALSSLSDARADTSEYGGMPIDDQQGQDDGGAAAAINHLHSERVARQACEQMIHHQFRADSPYPPVS